MTWARLVSSRYLLMGLMVCAGCGSPQPALDSAVSTAGQSTTGQPAASSSSQSSPYQSSPSPFVDAAHPPPYIDHVTWVQTAVGPSLQIYPTPNGRQSASDDGAAVAWAEVVRLAPTANSPGMQAQFDCHWTYARLVEPNKPSWNIEPDRPVVTEQEMVAARCNPGAPEE